MNVPRQHRTARNRRAILNLERLDRREVLSSATALWIGQVGVDHVGPWNELRPSTIQDIKVRLDNLPTDRVVLRAVVQGYGADRWEFGGPPSSWLVNLNRTAGSSTADMYFEPTRQESGREFNVGLTFDDGSFQEIYFAGGFADPNLRMPGQGVAATWLGAAAGTDLTTPSASVGPDGQTDLQIRLERLDASKTIEAIDVVDASGVWIASFGQNPSRVGTMEFSPDASGSGTGVATFSLPHRAMTGPLTVQVTYRGGSRDSTSVALGSTATAPVVLPATIAFRAHQATAQWLGQIVADPSRPGWTRVAVRDIPSSGVSAWQISDGFGQTWLWTVTGQGSPWAAVPGTKPLVAVKASSGQWFLEFDSRWDLTGETLTVMAAADSGSFYRVDLAGGAVDPAKRSPKPAGSEIVAAPGANLQALVDSYGTVRLSDGVYRLTEPLVLTRPVNVIGSAGTVLLFDQPESSPGWSTVIKLASGAIHLSGFKVRFEGPVKWLDDIRYGPAVIGSPDNYDTFLGRVGPMSDLAIDDLDIIGPAPNHENEEAARLIRLIDDVSGRVAGNVFFGGLIEMTGGPWTVADNRIDGTWVGSFSYDAFAFHDVRGLNLQDNVVTRGPNSGPIMRFLVVNGDSRDIVVAGNTVIGMGARFGDHPWIQELNAHEVILTEAYHVSYEGALMGIDATRRVVRVPTSLGRDYRPGDTLAVLTGGDAGAFRTVTAIVDGTTLVLDAPLPQWATVGTAVSINRGIANIEIRDNTIDQTDRPQSRALVLVGNLYDVDVTRNSFIGGFRGFQIMAYPSESPRDWGWTRNVVFGVNFSGNTMTDVLWYNQINVSHNTYARANFGHLYLTASVTGNVFAWSQKFLIEQIWQQPGDAHLVLPGLELGEGGKWDDTEARVVLGTNFIGLPEGWLNRPAVWTRSGTVNGKPAAGEVLHLSPLPMLAAPSGLGLVHDSGSSATDRLTNDPRLSLDEITGLSYEYRRAGSNEWQAVPDPLGWLPIGASEGTVVIETRAVDLVGRTGPVATFAFVLDTAAPESPTDLSRLGTDSVRWTPSSAADVASQEVRLSNAQTSETIVTTATATTASFSRWIIGANTIEATAIDAAGNRSTPLVGTFDDRPNGAWGGQDGSDFAALSTTLRPDGKQDVRLDIVSLPYGTSVVAVTVSAFGGGEWASPVTSPRQFAGAWRPDASGRSGRFYFQPNRAEIGRPFLVTLRFADDTEFSFWITGGTAAPNLPASGSGTPRGGVRIVSASMGAATSNSAQKPAALSAKQALAKRTVQVPPRALPRPIALRQGQTRKN